jgi:dihydrodipicolinate synthase/N-acetylneuraminate lyase
MAEFKKYSGLIVPMVSPFTKDGKIDQEATINLSEHLIKSGAAPFVLGTTGESASIPERECQRLVETMVKTVSGRTKTYAGISSNSFDTSLNAAKLYAELGVDVVVSHLPCYYPLSEDDMLHYFEKLANDIPIPLILYNITSVTHLSITLKVAEQLSYHENIVGLKESERDMDRLFTSIKMWKNRADFSHFIGWGAQMAKGLSHGADGIVPSTGNVIPQLYQSLYQSVLAGNLEEANRLQEYTNEISLIYQKNQTLGQSLAALKVMLTELNLCAPYVLPPLRRLNKAEEERIIKEMKRVRIHANE